MNENLKQPAPLMELRGITKRFPGVTAPFRCQPEHPYR